MVCGHFCPKDHQQHLMLAEFYSKINVSDWDLSSLGLRENWENGERSRHYPYKTATWPQSQPLPNPSQRRDMT